MTEIWKDITGYEGLYQVSTHGRVKSLPFKQRFVSKKGKECYRTTSEKIISTRVNNSGYILVHLCRDNVARTFTAHRLVALAFVPGYAEGLDVNHKDGVKANCHADNLEWVTRTRNHLHAVDLGLNKQAIPVIDPATGIRYPSIYQAARATKKNHRTVSATYPRAA